MKSENIWLLGLAGLLWYWYSSRPTSNVPSPYPRPLPRQPTGSGGVTAGSGMTNPLPGGTVPQGGQVPTGSGGVVATGTYITCDDGTLVNDPSLCPSGTGYLTCPDGTLANDLSLCPSTSMDTMDPCDPNSIAYDPTQCGVAVGFSAFDGGSGGDYGTGTADAFVAF